MFQYSFVLAKDSLYTEAMNEKWVKLNLTLLTVSSDRDL